MKFEDSTIINMLKEYYKGQAYSRLGGTMSLNGRSNKVIQLINGYELFFMARQP